MFVLEVDIVKTQRYISVDSDVIVLEDPIFHLYRQDGTIASEVYHNAT